MGSRRAGLQTINGFKQKWDSAAHQTRGRSHTYIIIMANYQSPEAAHHCKLICVGPRRQICDGNENQKKKTLKRVIVGNF